MKPALIFTCGLVTGAILTAVAFCRKCTIVLPWHCPDEPGTPEESTNATEAKDEGEHGQDSDSFVAPGEDSGNPSTDARESGIPAPDSERNDAETAEPVIQAAPEATKAEAVNQAKPDMQSTETTAQPADVPHAAVAAALHPASQDHITETATQQAQEATALVPSIGAAAGASA